MSSAAASLQTLVAVRAGDLLTQLRAEAGLDAEGALDRTAFAAVFAGAGRRLGTAPLGAGAEISDDDGDRWSIAGWGLDEAGRALLLLTAIACVPTDDQVEWVEECYREGALRERQAILRTLAALPMPGRFLGIALDASRVSIQPIFEAIACDNPYPARYFPDSSFNQLALKAVFTELPLARIVDLEQRLTPELARMADDYASERRAAGRSVPADLIHLTKPKPRAS